jgi:predicted nucleotidyltransferase component of viral defense system
MRIPLEKRIRKRRQLEMARLQDVLADFAASLGEPAVFHGGTAIWRVYSGKRFSEDLDFCLEWRDSSAMRARLERFLKPHGITVAKFKDTGNTLFIDAERGGVHVRLEFSNQRRGGYVVGAFERVDGSFASLYTLPPEELFKEKVAAYSSRRMVRDIYDIVFLYPLCDRRAISADVAKLKRSLAPPVDEETLKALVVEGLAPSYDAMKKTIGRW